MGAGRAIAGGLATHGADVAITDFDGDVAAGTVDLDEVKGCGVIAVAAESPPRSPSRGDDRGGPRADEANESQRNFVSRGRGIPNDRRLSRGH